MVESSRITQNTSFNNRISATTMMMHSHQLDSECRPSTKLEATYCLLATGRIENSHFQL